jgi:hypothetical protein
MATDFTLCCTDIIIWGVVDGCPCSGSVKGRFCWVLVARLLVRGVLSTKFEVVATFRVCLRRVFCFLLGFSRLS